MRMTTATTWSRGKSARWRASAASVAGAKFGQETDLNEGDFFNAGLKYGFGAANVSVGYVRFNPDEGDDNNLFAAPAISV